MKASIAIAADFRERIARGELADGQALPVESELVEGLGVSKGVVREALRILENEGLIEVRRGLGGGPRVRHPSIADAAARFGVYLQIGDVLVGDIWRSRDRIVAGSVERLAEERDASAVLRLDAAVDHLTALVGDFHAYYPQLLDLGELAVALSGSRTDHVLVAALRHVVAAELEAVTSEVVDKSYDLERAVNVEQDIAQTWRDLVRHIRYGHAAAARRAYEAQAEVVLGGLLVKVDAETVGEVLRGEAKPFLS